MYLIPVRSSRRCTALPLPYAYASYCNTTQRSTWALVFFFVAGSIHLRTMRTAICSTIENIASLNDRRDAVSADTGVSSGQSPSSADDGTAYSFIRSAFVGREDGSSAEKRSSPRNSCKWVVKNGSPGLSLDIAPSRLKPGLPFTIAISLLACNTVST